MATDSGAPKSGEGALLNFSHIGPGSLIDDPVEDGGRNFEAAKTRAGLGFSSLRAAALLLANTLLGGSGMLGIPHAFSVTGYALALGMLVFFGCASAFGCHLLHVSARRIGIAPCSFYTVTSASAPRWTWLIDGAVACGCFGVATSYLIIVGDLLPDAVAGLGGFRLLRWHAITIGFAVAAPLACLSSLSALRHTAAVSVVITSWTAVLIVLFYLGAFDPCQEEQGDQLPCGGAEFRAVPSDWLEMSKAVPVFIFGFTSQVNIFTVCNEMEDASKQRVDGVIGIAYWLTGVTFAVTAFFGCATYGSAVGENVLMNFPRTPLVNTTRALFSLLAVLSYPLLSHPSRASWLALLRMLVPLRSGGESASDRWSASDARAAGIGGEDGPARFAAVTACMLALSYSVAITVGGLGVVLAVVGATASTLLSYILPGIVYLKSTPDPGSCPPSPSLTPRVKRQLQCKRGMAWVLLAAGLVIMPTALVLIFV